MLLTFKTFDHVGVLVKTLLCLRAAPVRIVSHKIYSVIKYRIYLKSDNYNLYACVKVNSLNGIITRASSKYFFLQGFFPNHARFDNESSERLKVIPHAKIPTQKPIYRNALSLRECQLVFFMFLRLLFVPQLQWPKGSGG